MAMSDSSTEKITLYVSNWCVHSRTVEGFLDRNNVAVDKIKIDGDQQARSDLIEINDGYASVPTLIFPDGSKLTEPSLSQLRAKLGLEASDGLVGRIRGILGGNSPE